MLKKYCKLNRDDLILGPAILLGLFLVTHVVTLIALSVTHEHSSILISGVLLPLAGGFVLGIVSMCTVLVSHDLNQSFSCTRRRSLALLSGQLLAEFTLCLVCCWSFSALEKAVFPTLWKTLLHFDNIQFADSSTFASSQLENILFIEDLSLAWFWPVLILLGALALGIVAGTIIRRFGTKGGWTIWLFFMLGMFCGIDLVHLPYFPIVLSIGAVLLILAFFWSVYELLHSPVHT